VATVDQTATVVGTVIVTDTDSVYHSETDEAQTVTVSTTVIVSTGVGTIYDVGTPTATVSTYVTV
jgi:hypothetical protein